MNRLRNPAMAVPPSPRFKPPIRRDAPYSQTLPRYPRRPTDRPSDIADFILNVSSLVLSFVLCGWLVTGYNHYLFASFVGIASSRFRPQCPPLRHCTDL